MRTTVNLADDVQAEVDRLRRTEGLGTSDAVNTLVRRGMNARRDVPRTADLGIKVDVSNIAEVLEMLDDEP